ncbi:hypothetical protein ANTRET_LOCUS10890 [Anthophora retusa]
MRGRPSDSMQTTFDEAIHAFRRIEKDKIRYAEQRKVRFQEEFRRPTQQRFYQGRDRSPSPYRQTDQPRTPWRQNQAQQQYRRDYSPSRAVPVGKRKSPPAAHEPIAGGDHPAGSSNERRKYINNIQEEETIDLPYIQLESPQFAKTAKLMIDSGAEPNLIKITALKAGTAVNEERILRMRGITDGTATTLGAVSPTKIGPAIPAEATTTIIIIQPTKIGPAKSAEATTTIITIQPTKIGPAETAESTTTIIITQPTKIGQADTAEATTTITIIQPTKIGPAEAAKTTKKISAGILKATNRKSSISNPT